jgi:hypothetical protein
MIDIEKIKNQKANVEKTIVEMLREFMDATGMVITDIDFESVYHQVIGQKAEYPEIVNLSLKILNPFD